LWGESCQRKAGKPAMVEARIRQAEGRLDRAPCLRRTTVLVAAGADSENIPRTACMSMVFIVPL